MSPSPLSTIPAISDPPAVVGLGHAVMDLVCPVGEAFLVAHGLAKGGMSLVEPATAAALRVSAPSRAVVRAGGSAANTLSALGALGVPTRLLARCGTDVLGEAFVQALGARGCGVVEHGSQGRHAAQAADTLPTGHCLVFTTPDGERTMATCLGAAPHLDAAACEALSIPTARFLYLEGYLWDSPPATAALERALRLAAETDGVRVALSLSDGFCVERHRAAFLAACESGVDLLFGNEREMMLLTGADSRAGAGRAAANLVPESALTLGAEGSLVQSGGTAWRVAARATQVVDATGAGDFYAAGYLWGRLAGLSAGRSGGLGSLAASCVLEHAGAYAGEDFAPRVRAGLDEDLDAPELAATSSAS